MRSFSNYLTPLQHQRQLGRLIMPLMYILNSGLGEIGEAQLADLSNQNLETCRLQLRRLSAYGYLERCARYHGYVLTPMAYAVLPERPSPTGTTPRAPVQVVSSSSDPRNPAALPASHRDNSADSTMPTPTPRIRPLSRVRRTAAIPRTRLLRMVTIPRCLHPMVQPPSPPPPTRRPPTAAISR